MRIIRRAGKNAIVDDDCDDNNFAGEDIPLPEQPPSPPPPDTTTSNESEALALAAVTVDIITTGKNVVIDNNCNDDNVGGEDIPLPEQPPSPPPPDATKSDASEALAVAALPPNYAKGTPSLPSNLNKTTMAEAEDVTTSNALEALPVVPPLNLQSTLMDMDVSNRGDRRGSLSNGARQGLVRAQ